MKAMIFPYPTLRGGIEMEIAEVRADGSKLNLDPARLAEKSLEIDQLNGHDWNRLSILVDAQAQPNVLAEFEEEHGSVDATVVAACRPTNVRQGTRLERSSLDPSRWSGIINLDHDSFREKVGLVCMVTGCANSIANRPVALSSAWTFYFDPTDSFKVAGSLRVKWCNFKDDSAPPLAKRFQDAAYVVDMDKSLPEIILNLSFEGLEPILRDTKARTRIEQALHDSTRMAIARSVWMALVADSMSAIRTPEDDEDPEWPVDGWHTEVLKRVLPEIDPTRSESELLRLAAKEWRTHPGSATFLSRAEAAIGEIIQANKSLRKTAQTLIREGIVS